MIGRAAVEPESVAGAPDERSPIAATGAPVVGTEGVSTGVDAVPVPVSGAAAMAGSRLAARARVRQPPILPQRSLCPAWCRPMPLEPGPSSPRWWPDEGCLTPTLRAPTGRCLRREGGYRESGTWGRRVAAGAIAGPHDSLISAVPRYGRGWSRVAWMAPSGRAASRRIDVEAVRRHPFRQPLQMDVVERAGPSWTMRHTPSECSRQYCHQRPPCPGSVRNSVRTMVGASPAPAG